jgi:GATA-binding protein
MKKSIIKRRKRVVPAAQGAQAIDVANNSMGSPESDRQSPPGDRGSINPDGSVNLGFRMRNTQGHGLLPEPSMRSQNGQQVPTSDLTAYASTSNSHTHTHEQHPESLNDDNRLPPMTSYPSPTNRRTSLSPSSFLSPSRKRSFSATEIEARPNLSEMTSTHPKRLSSIKSILNPGFAESDPKRHSPSRELDPSLRDRYPGASTPGSSAQYATSPSNSGSGSALNSGKDAQSETERSKLERREMLQREAERMREALKAKERELAELGGLD